MRAALLISAEKTAGRVESTEWVTGDLGNLKALTEACSNVSVVFHVAGIAHIFQSSGGYYPVNIQGTRTVAEACIAAAVPKLVFLSAGWLRAPIPLHMPIRKKSRGHITP